MSGGRSAAYRPRTGTERRDEISFAMGVRKKAERPDRNNVRVEKKIQQKWLDGLERIRPAELKQHDADLFFPASYLPRCREFLRRSTSSCSAAVRLATLR